MSGASETSGAIHRTRAITCSSLSGWRYSSRKSTRVRTCLPAWLRRKRNRLPWRSANRLATCRLVTIRSSSMRQPVPHQSMLSWSINSSRPTERIGVASAARCFFRRCSRPASGASSKIPFFTSSTGRLLSKMIASLKRRESKNEASDSGDTLLPRWSAICSRLALYAGTLLHSPRAARWASSSRVPFSFSTEQTRSSSGVARRGLRLRMAMSLAGRISLAGV